MTLWLRVKLKVTEGEKEPLLAVGFQLFADRSVFFSLTAKPSCLRIAQSHPLTADSWLYVEAKEKNVSVLNDVLLSF